MIALNFIQLILNSVKQKLKCHIILHENFKFWKIYKTLHITYLFRLSKSSGSISHCMCMATHGGQSETCGCWLFQVGSGDSYTLSGVLGKRSYLLSNHSGPNGYLLFRSWILKGIWKAKQDRGVVLRGTVPTQQAQSWVPSLAFSFPSKRK